MSGCTHRNHHHHHQNLGSEKRLLWAALITGLFMFAEVIGGIISGSLALLADAGHMFTDFASLLMAWFAFRLTRRPADKAKTFGYERMQILVAFVNGLTLLFISLLIVKEAFDRFYNPIDIQANLMITIAFLGLLINIVAFFILHGADKENLNIQGAVLHVIGDMLGSVAALIGGILILTKGWTIVDPILSCLIALILIRSAWFVIRESSHILLQNTPRMLDLEQLRKNCIERFNIVEDIHHLHAWCITQDRTVVTMHVKLNKRISPEEITAEIKKYLFDEYNIDHTTIEIEFELCSDDMIPSLSATC